MTIVARRIGAVPVRMPSETWDFIIDLIAAADEAMRPHLESARNAASLVISEEHSRTDPMVLTGCGPQVRFYTLHGMEAIDDSRVMESRLSIRPSSTWEMALPVGRGDFALVSAALEGNPRVMVYDPAKGRPTQQSGPDDGATPAPITVNLHALKE